MLIFNPDNDLALADGRRSYMPTQLVKRMTGDLALLPFWTQAGAKESVLCEGEEHRLFLQRMQEILPLKGCMPVGKGQAAATAKVEGVLPWGWSPRLRRILECMGVSEECLPAGAELADVRRLSGREVAVEVLGRVRSRVPDVIGEAEVIRTAEACEAYVRKLGTAVLKMPLSSSGKGLYWCREGMDNLVRGWVERGVSKQGVVVASPIYNKVYDLSMLFERGVDGRFRCMAPSIFNTDGKGAYEGHRLLSAGRIRKHFCRLFGGDVVNGVEEVLTDELNSRYGSNPYFRYIGVDMMACRLPDGQLRLHPCVEINARMSMGVVATDFFRQYVHPQCSGFFCIDSCRTPQELLAKHQNDSAAAPLRVADGRIVSGYMALTPLTPDSLFRASVRIGG